MRAIQGYCPACGQEELGHREVSHNNPARIIGSVFCANPKCPQPEAAHLILQDPEIHHVVRFDERGFFNVKHPLLERVEGPLSLLTCGIHEVILSECEGEGGPGEGAWRLRPAGEHNLDRNWVWECL
jgi:hypothetical protein